MLGNDERKCLELQADSLAFALLLHHAVFLDNSTEDLWSWINDKQDSDSIDITIMVEKIRLIMLAAVCVILVIEQMRRKILDNTEMSSTYPLPLTRLTNLVAATIRLIGEYTGTIREKNDGRLVLDATAYNDNSELFSELTLGLAGGILGATVIAEALGVADLLIGNTLINFKENYFDIENYNNNLLFIQNLQYYMLDSSFRLEGNSYQALALNEYANLHITQKKLTSFLENYSLIEIQI